MTTWSRIRLLSAVILANFIVQVPYAIHQYGLTFLANVRGLVLMGAVFALFVAGYLLLARGKALGYRLLCGFLALEFVFYLLTVVGEIAQGFGAFYHLHDPSLTLRAVFGIGYLNLFASGYFLYLLVRRKDELLASR